MHFCKEPKGYAKTALSDLQGAFGNLREEVVASVPFPGWERLLFHVDEAMSWESVRNLAHMRDTVLLIRNIATWAPAPQAVMEWIDIVQENLDEVLEIFKKRST